MDTNVLAMILHHVGEELHTGQKKSPEKFIEGEY